MVGGAMGFLGGAIDIGTTSDDALLWSTAVPALLGSPVAAPDTWGCKGVCASLAAPPQPSAAVSSKL
jgi:hypothetical protein